MTSQPSGVQQSIRFGEDFALDLRPRRLRRGSHVLKLERIPLEILVLLLEHRGEIVSRDEIVARVWGNDRAAYTEAKSDVILGILDQAEAWAAANGWGIRD